MQRCYQPWVGLALRAGRKGSDIDGTGFMNEGSPRVARPSLAVARARGGHGLEARATRQETRAGRTSRRGDCLNCMQRGCYRPAEGTSPRGDVAMRKGTKCADA